MTTSDGSRFGRTNATAAAAMPTPIATIAAVLENKVKLATAAATSATPIRLWPDSIAAAGQTRSARTAMPLSKRSSTSGQYGGSGPVRACRIGAPVVASINMSVSAVAIPAGTHNRSGTSVAPDMDA